MVSKFILAGKRLFFVNPVKFIHTKIDCQVTVPQGVMRGRLCNTPCGKQYYSFEGIPYAKPPVGPLRFKDPENSGKWCGILDATKPSKKSIQINPNTKLLEGSEDCLYLNVYTPILPHETERRLPVLFFVHGGNFTMGSGVDYRPDYLLRHDVILVTINYRLNIFGFLCLHTPDVPGNAGLKDAAMALKWVKDNIEHFGGDSNNIVGFGESVGAFIVTSFLISNITRGLVSKIIALSSPLSDDIISNDPIGRAKKIAAKLGEKKSKAMYDVFMNASVEDLMAALTFVAAPHIHEVQSYLRPTIERKFDIKPYFNEYPLQSLRTNQFTKVPTLMSVASHEGAYLIINAFGEMKFNKNILKFLPRTVLMNNDTEQLLEIETNLKKLYFQDRKICLFPLNQYTHIVSDLYLIRDILYTADLLSRQGDLYLCRFGYNGNLHSSIMKRFGLEGATHSDILQYLFYKEKKAKAGDENDMKIVDILSEALCNFAKTGKPTWVNQEVDWIPYNEENRVCLNIENSIDCVPFPEMARIKALKNILSSYT